MSAADRLREAASFNIRVWTTLMRLAKAGFPLPAVHSATPGFGLDKLGQKPVGADMIENVLAKARLRPACYFC